jgi:hypothetical protein
MTMKTESTTNKPAASRWYHCFVRRLLGVDEALEELRSINRRLETLESCVRPGVRHRDRTPHIVTGHWND